MTTFGETLRTFRHASNDPYRLRRRLSQGRLGRLIGEEMGDLGFTGAAVAYWESGKSKISAEDRKVLLALIQVLHRCGGLKTIPEANHLLELGNYRVLDETESQKIFGEVLDRDTPERSAVDAKAFHLRLLFLFENLLAVSEGELSTLIAKAREGPKPLWPRVLAALMRKVVDQFSISRTALLWIWIGLVAWWSVGPSLRLPFADQDTAIHAMAYYAGGTLLVPLIIGAFINTKDNAYWMENGLEKSILLRLYTYQGAGIGFNLGYLIVFPFSLTRYYLQLEPSVWVEITAVTIGLILGNIGARVVPHNLWLAYGRLKLSDGAIFFSTALLGPFWGFFFLKFYSILLMPVTGIVVILLALTVVVILTTRQPNKV